MKIIQRDSFLEELSSGELNVDWNNASTYFDTFKKQSVMEAPIINSPLSKNVPNWENAALDTLILANIKTDHRLLVIQDSLGTMTYAIMKIEGSFSNHLDYNILTNSYRGISPIFVGFIIYVNEKDTLLARHIIKDGKVYTVTKMDGLQGSGNDVQDRDWIECFYVYSETPCTCSPHHSLGQSGCTCDHGAYWTITQTCHGYGFSSSIGDDSGGSSNYPGIGGGYGPSQGQVGGPSIGGPGYGGNQDNPYGAGSNFLLLTNKFKAEFGINLLDPDLVEMAEACWWNGISYGSFSDSAREGLINKFLVENPNITLTQQERNWLKENFEEFLKTDSYLETELHSQDAQEAANVHIELLTTNAEYRQLVEAYPTIPDWAKDIIKEMLVEAAEKILKKFIPGASLSEDVKEAIINCPSGDMLPCIGNMIGILKNFFPALKLVDTAIESTLVIQKLAKLYNKLEDTIDKIGTSASEKLWKAMTKNIKVLDDINVDDWPLGIRFNNKTIDAFWDDLMDAFQVSLGDITNYSSNGQPAKRFGIGGINVAYYFSSSGYWTITINGDFFKFRF